MPTKRQLITSTLSFAAWPALRSFATAPSSNPGSGGAPEDETYWAHVRSEFELDPEFTNLVSVVTGNFTKANREIAFSEATRLNRLPGPRPDPDREQEIRRRVAAFIGAPPDTAPYRIRTGVLALRAAVRPYHDRAQRRRSRTPDRHRPSGGHSIVLVNTEEVFP